MYSPEEKYFIDYTYNLEGKRKPTSSVNLTPPQRLLKTVAEFVGLYAIAIPVYFVTAYYAAKKRNDAFALQAKNIPLEIPSLTDDIKLVKVSSEVWVQYAVLNFIAKYFSSVIEHEDDLAEDAPLINLKFYSPFELYRFSKAAGKRTLLASALAMCFVGASNIPTKELDAFTSEENQIMALAIRTAKANHALESAEKYWCKTQPRNTPSNMSWCTSRRAAGYQQADTFFDEFIEPRVSNASVIKSVATNILKVCQLASNKDKEACDFVENKYEYKKYYPTDSDLVAEALELVKQYGKFRKDIR